MGLEEEYANPSNEEIIKILHQRLDKAKAEINRLNDVCDNCGYDVDLKTLCSENTLLIEENYNLKEENNRLRALLGSPYKKRIDLENRGLIKQNKQLTEVLDAIANGVHFADNVEEHLRLLAKQALENK